MSAIRRWPLIEVLLYVRYKEVSAVEEVCYWEGSLYY